MKHNDFGFKTNDKKPNKVQITVTFDADRDADLIKYLWTKRDKSAYIRKLIRKDIETIS